MHRRSETTRPPGGTRLPVSGLLAGGRPLAILALATVLTLGGPGSLLAQHGAADGAEDVRFASDELTLGGLFFAPDGEGPFPAAVFIRGSGPSSRDSYWARAVVELLNARGVAALLPDKRGSGESDGDWRTADFRELAGDALAGVRYLRGRPDVLDGSVGLIGLSQGGKIAPVAAAGSGEVAWVVNLVGAATTFREQVSWEMYHTFREAEVAGADLQEALELQLEAEAYVRGRTDWATYRARLDEALTTPWAAVAEGFPSSEDAWQWGFFRRVIDFDPLPHWRRVRQPVLVFYGEEDHNAPAVRSAYRLLRAFRETGHEEATVRVVPGAGHALWDPEAGDPHRPPLHPEVVETMTAWLEDVVASPLPPPRSR